MSDRYIDFERKLKEHLCEKDINHSLGKKTARERIDMLFDKGSFIELDSFVETSLDVCKLNVEKFLGDGVITGYGRVCGVTVFAAIQDFSFLGGSLGKKHAEKIIHVQQLALKLKSPIVFMNDSGGARIQEGVDALSGYGEIFSNNVLASGKILQICMILGPCAGGAVYSPALMDFIFMTDEISKMFITGPEVIKQVTGNNYTPEELGGVDIHCKKSGVAHFHSNSELEMFKDVKKLISFFYLSDFSVKSKNKKRRIDEIVPKERTKAYDAHDLIDCILDDGLIEYQSEFACNVITGFGFIDGNKVGIVSSNPRVKAGCLDVDASDKIARFVNTCNSFSVPIITFQDVPGFFPSKQEEEKGIERHGAKVIYAYTKAEVPKITVIIRKAFGGAYIAMCSKHIGADFVFAWPSAEIAVMGAEGAVSIIYKKEIQSSSNPKQLKDEKVEEYTAKFMNPYIAAKKGYVDDVILPDETHQKIVSCLKLFETTNNQIICNNYPV